MKPRPEPINSRIITFLFLSPVLILIYYLYSLLENGESSYRVLETYLKYRSQATGIFFFIFLVLSVYQQYQAVVFMKNPKANPTSIGQFTPPAILAIILLVFAYPIAEFFSNLF